MMTLPEPLTRAGLLPWEAGLAVEPAGADLPGLSIVIPIYNAGDFLERTIRSLLCNDLSGVEIIVMDGGSTDNTAEILAHYEGVFATVVSEEDEGQSDALNKGFARASNDILHWLNGDDVVLPNVLNAVRRAFRDNPGAGLVVGDAALTELDLTVIHQSRLSPGRLTFERLKDYSANHLIQPSVFFSRRAWEACGPLNGALDYAMDADLFLAMAARFRIHHVAREVAYSVYHEGCKTRKKRAESIAELAMVQARHGAFDEAARTLDLLVDLYNQAVAGAGNDTPSYGTGDAGVLVRRMQALEAQVEKNRALLLAQDLKQTR